jgi:hypothetical protein
VAGTLTIPNNGSGNNFEWASLQQGATNTASIIIGSLRKPSTTVSVAVSMIQTE